MGSEKLKLKVIYGTQVKLRPSGMNPGLAPHPGLLLLASFPLTFPGRNEGESEKSPRGCRVVADTTHSKRNGKGLTVLRVVRPKTRVLSSLRG